ncbi:MAG: VCBS repeat-containing protein [Planctomycetota bacterium]
MASKIALLFVFSLPAQAQQPLVAGYQKIGEGAGGFPYTYPAGNAEFGASSAYLGDLNGDGRPEVAVGAPEDAFVAILSLNPDGTVHETSYITHDPSISSGQYFFGKACAAIGDIDGDGVPDLVVRTTDNCDGALTVVELAINAITGAIESGRQTLISGSQFSQPEDCMPIGFALAALGDLDGNGVRDIAATSVTKDPGPGGLTAFEGRVTFIFMELAGDAPAVKTFKTIEGASLPTPGLQLGYSCTIGHVDDDEFIDVICTSHPGTTPELRVLFLDQQQNVKSQATIGGPGYAGSLKCSIDQADHFGSALWWVDDDPNYNLLVGATHDDDGGSDFGAGYRMKVAPDGSVTCWEKISATAGGAPLPLDDFDFFGSSICPLGDLNEDGVRDVLIGARFDGGLNCTGSAHAGACRLGAAWVVFLNRNECLSPGSTVLAGSGVNPVELSSVSLPQIGSTWRGVISPSVPSSIEGVVLSFTGATSAFSLGTSGDLLIGINPPPLPIPQVAGTYDLPVPCDPSFLGREVAVQGYRLIAGHHLILLNALLLLVGP